MRLLKPSKLRMVLRWNQSPDSLPFFQEYFPTLHNQRESGLHRDEYLWLQPDQIGFSKFGSTHTGD